MWKSKRPRHAFDSYCASVDDDLAAQKFSHMGLVVDAILLADQITFDKSRTNPTNADSEWGFNIRFGEHYRLLAALSTLLNPNAVVEVGTSTGASARAFIEYTPHESKVYTFDIFPWHSFAGTWLCEEDFKSGRLTQYLDDLSLEENFAKHEALFTGADLIFCDAPKDGDFEYKFLDRLSKVAMPNKQRFLILDDIKFLNMAALWRSIESPKIDLTSFGHWSGTGLVDVSEGLKLK